METFPCFIDLQAAYDLVPRDLLFPALESCGLPTTIVQILHSVCESAEFCVRVGAGATSNAFQSGRGLLQGSVVSPALLMFTCKSTLMKYVTAGITGGLVRTRYDGDELKCPPSR